MQNKGAGRGRGSEKILMRYSIKGGKIKGVDDGKKLGCYRAVDQFHIRECVCKLKVFMLIDKEEPPPTAHGEAYLCCGWRLFTDVMYPPPSSSPELHAASHFCTQNVYKIEISSKESLRQQCLRATIITSFIGC